MILAKSAKQRWAFATGATSARRKEGKSGQRARPVLAAAVYVSPLVTKIIVKNATFAHFSQSSQRI